MHYIRKILIAVAIVLPLLAIYVVVKTVDGINDAYAQWDAVDLVIDYMESHDGKWPPNWEALQPVYAAAEDHRVADASLEWLQERVAIDFDVDAEELRRQSIESEDVPFNVIGARSFFASQHGDGPNADLHRYFRSKVDVADENSN